MQLQNQEQNQKLQSMVQEYNQVTTEFKHIQDRMSVIQQNIDRNKKMIFALEQENQELQNKSDNIIVSEVGEVDFSDFDSYADEVGKNNRKIKALENVVSKFEKEFTYSLYNEYENYKRKRDNLSILIYEFVGTELLNEFFSDQIILEKMNKNL